MGVVRGWRGGDQEGEGEPLLLKKEAVGPGRKRLGNTHPAGSRNKPRAPEEPFTEASKVTAVVAVDEEAPRCIFGAV